MTYEPSLFYAPPYERPVEDEFAWHLVKYLDARAGVQYQARVETPAGPFWVDFLVEMADAHGTLRRFAFEISEPDADADKEAMRDALLVGQGALDGLFRFQSEDLLYRLHDALWCVRCWEGTLFSQRGKVNLETLASLDALQVSLRPDAREVAMPYALPDLLAGQTFEGEKPEPLEGEARTLRVLQYSGAHPSTWVQPHEAALVYYGITPEQASRRWAQSA